jgi:lysophospholipase L1-like esterase
MQSRTRIVALGDSTTAGTPGFLSPLEAPPKGRGDKTSQYAYWLMNGRPDWEVLNRGLNGERSDQIAERFDRDVIRAAPAAVVIIAGVNDIYQGLPVDHVTDHLRLMYERAVRGGLKVVAGTIVPFNTATASQNDKMRSVNAWIEREAHDRPSLAFANTRAAVALPDWPDRLIESPDELHPSPRGYRLMAEAIRPALEHLLRRSAADAVSFKNTPPTAG